MYGGKGKEYKDGKLNNLNAGYSREQISTLPSRGVFAKLRS